MLSTWSSFCAPALREWSPMIAWSWVRAALFNTPTLDWSSFARELACATWSWTRETSMIGRVRGSGELGFNLFYRGRWKKSGCEGRRLSRSDV